jgi:hypothetical protein
MDGTIGPAYQARPSRKRPPERNPVENSALYLRDYLHGNATEPLLVARLHGV